MSEIPWEVLRNGVYHIDGSWRDIYVRDTNGADWVKWAGFVNGNYKLTWFAEDNQGGARTDSIDQDYLRDYWTRGPERLTTTTTIDVGKVQLNCHFFSEAEIENDLDPMQVQSIDDHNGLMAYMKALSKLLNKEVVLTEENVKDAVWIRINGESIHFVD